MFPYFRFCQPLILSITIIYGCAVDDVSIENAQNESIINSLGRKLPSDAAPLNKQILSYFIEEPQTLDVSIDNYGVKGSDLFLFERLTMFDHDDLLRSGVASHWESSEDGRIWTFYLRKDARWSDGRELTANDFEYTFKRFLDPKEGNAFAFLFYQIKNARAFNHGVIDDPNLLGINALDKNILQITTENPCPYLPFIMAYNSAAPVPSWQVKKYGKRWTLPENMVSNYSYKLSEWITDRYISYELNPYYNGPYPGYLEKIKLKFIGIGQHPGISPYENNEVDRQQIVAQYLKQVEDTPELKRQLTSNPHFQTWYLFFRTRVPPFNDLRIRRAISHAIDREAICNVILQGHGTPAYTMLPPGFPGYTGDKLKTVQNFDLDKARGLLKEAGFPRGKGFPTIELWLRQADLTQMAIAQMIQSVFKDELGIRVKIKNQEIGLYMKNMYDYTIPFGLIPYQYDYPDPENMLTQVWHSQPLGYGRQDWKNKSFDSLLKAGGITMDTAERMKFYGEAEKILVTDVGGVFIYHTHVLDLRKPWFKGLETNSWGQDLFWGNRTNLMDIYIGNTVEERHL